MMVIKAVTKGMLKEGNMTGRNSFEDCPSQFKIKYMKKGNFTKVIVRSQTQNLFSLIAWNALALQLNHRGHFNKQVIRLDSSKA